MMELDSSSPYGTSTPASSVDEMFDPPSKNLVSRLETLSIVQRGTPESVEQVIPKTVRTICCVGAGYVGGPTAAVIAFNNPHIQVSVVDKDPHRIRKWNSQHLPIHEPGLVDVTRVARDGLKASPGTSEPRAPNLTFSTEVSRYVSQADVILLSVNTPTKISGIGAGRATNLVALEGATRDIALWAKPGAIIVEKSTVPCRTAESIRQILDVYRPGVPFEILSNPEFLAEGTAIKDLLNPDRILIGSAQTPSGLAAAKSLEQVYSAWVPTSRILNLNLWSSELAKLVANAMLAQRISSINTISAICESTGACISQISSAIGRDPRLGPKFLQAGIGFGGSCFKKDILNLVYLAETLHLPEVAEYWEQVLTINDFQRNRFVNKVVRNLNGTLSGKKLAIFGYAFKKDTSDTRESPAVEVIKSLMEDRPGEIAIFDPMCNPEDVRDELRQIFKGTGIEPLKPQGLIEVYSESYEAATNSSAILILTEFDQFRCPTLIREKSIHKEQRPAMERYDSAVGLDEIASAKDSEPQSNDISETYVEQPSCAEDCRDCSRGATLETKARLAVDWERIATDCEMRQPRWVFDGRRLVDKKMMEGLGFKVSAIGSADGML